MKSGSVLNVQSRDFTDVPRRLRTCHPLEGVVSSIMPADFAFDNTLMDESSGSKNQQLKAGVARPSINGSLALEDEHMLAGKSSMLSDTQRPSSGSVQVPDAGLLPCGLVADVSSTSVF